MMSIALWIMQGLLALLFLFGGVLKLTMPIEELTAQVPLPGLIIRIVAVLEVLGGLGLVLPGLFRIQTGLTPLAAAGLAIVMAGAVAINLGMGDPVAASMPLVIGLLAAFVAYGRWRIAPHRLAPQRSVLQPTA